MTKTLSVVLLLPRNIAVALLHGYRRIISPLYGDVCRYYPSCSRYALEAYQYRGVVVGTALTAWRLLRCNPWSSGGVDDVPHSPTSTPVLTRRGFVRFVNRKA